MTREREYVVLGAAGEDERSSKAKVGEPLQPRLSERRGGGLRGCITCLLPDRETPTKTLMSNVNSDNASATRPRFIRPGQILHEYRSAGASGKRDLFLILAVCAICKSECERFFDGYSIRTSVYGVL